MPWFRMDDGFHSHPKAKRAGLAAVGLWSLAGTYSAAYKLGGFVPEWFVDGWPQGRKHARSLVEARLWSVSAKDSEPGWQFHDWDDFQPTVEEIERDREHARERQRRRRENLRKARMGGESDAA